MIEIVIFYMYIVLISIYILRFLHIFQLSSYHFDEFVASLKKSKFYLPNIPELTLIIISVINYLFNIVYFNIVVVIFQFILLLYIILSKNRVKKKFVYTNRIKITLSILLLIIVIYSMIHYMYFTEYNKGIYIVLSFVKYVGILLIIISNFFAKYIVKLESVKYIKEAKEILKNNDVKIIGITGSYGKTSTKNMIYQILQGKFDTVKTPKSFNTPLGVVKSIRESVKPYTQIFICEMGARRVGEIKEICDIVDCDYSVLTSIGYCHLETFKTIDNIIKTKFEIVENSKPDAICILNYDNKYIEDNAYKYLNGREEISYSLDNSKADYTVTSITTNEHGSTFTLKYNNEEMVFETKLLGVHNIYNIVCGIIIAIDLEMTYEEIRREVKKIKPVEHRLELKNMNGILALDDSFNSNPEGSRIAIECLNLFKDKYKVIVTPGMIELGDKHYELNKKLGEYASFSDYVILVGEATTKPIQDGLDSKGFKDYEYVKDVYEAFEVLNKFKKEGKDLIALFENDLPDSYI